MAKKKSLVDQWREKLVGRRGKKVTKKVTKKSTDNMIPKEILDKLPPGVKIKRIEIGPKQILRTFITLLLIFWGLSVAADLFLPKEIVQVPISKIIEAVKEDKVKEMVVSDDEVVVTLKDEDKILISSKEPVVSMSEILQGEGINVGKINFRVENNKGWKAFGGILSLVLTVGLPLLLIFWMFSRQAGKGGAGGMFGFGKSTAKLFIKGKQSLKFADVAGVEEAKNDLMEVVDFLKHPEKYRKMGARAPKGVLLVGPAGVGKTLLARAVAGEANVPFYSMAGSEFMEMLVGIGASRARDLFSTAKKAGKAIIFIDEIDAIGRMRGGIDGGHGEREQTLNQILVEMDGFDANTAVVVLAASVGGETPIMIKEDGEVQVMRIGRFIDRYFDGEEEGEVEVKGIETLGFERKKYKHNLHRNNLYFSHSAFKKVNSVFRHKVKEIYEIKYIGGELRATGSHSVFVRSFKGLVTKAVSELKQGDVLVDVPFKVNRTNKELRKLRAHKFEENWRMELPVFDVESEEEWQGKYAYAMLAVGSQGEVAKLVGVSQGTVSNWRVGESGPRAISKSYFKHEFSENVRVTAELCRLLGYYTAEGYARWEVDFCFSKKEVDLVEDLIRLMKEIFGIEPDRIGRQTPGAVNIIYSAAPLAKFFIKQVGRGASHKHIPPFLFEAPKEYFVEFLRGLWKGDGYQDKRGKGEITSVSQGLILELNWLARMHGIKTYMGGFVAKEGRRISGGKPLSAVRAYRLGWGKAANPFEDFEMEKNYPSKRAVVTEVKRVPFEGFVYDLCGVENEAFFGGESPVLLHNTNRGDLLDPALLRPGRFDRRVVLEMPDIEDRKGILAIHAKGKPFVKVLDWEAVARRTVGFSGADLENMLNEAAIKAARENKTEIAMEDIEDAALKVKLGAEKRRKQTEEDRLMTAYHEAGHAIVSFVEGLDPVHRISIVSRGIVLGYTLIPPKQDRVHETRSRLIKQMAMAMGGRAAEDLVFSDLTTGAAVDISYATGLARNMVVEWGMSDLGPVNMGPQIDVDNFGKAYFEPSNISDRMLARVDREIGKLVNEAFERARRVLAANKKKLEKVAKVLVEKESLDEKEFAELMK